MRREMKDALFQPPFCMEYCTYEQLAKTLSSSTGPDSEDEDDETGPKTSLKYSRKAVREKQSNVILIMDEGKTLWNPPSNADKEHFETGRQKLFGHRPGQLAAYIIADWSPAGSGDPAQFTSMLMTLKGAPWENLHVNKHYRPFAQQSTVTKDNIFFMIDIEKTEELQKITSYIKENNCPASKHVSGEEFILVDQDEDEADDLDKATIPGISHDRQGEPQLFPLALS